MKHKHYFMALFALLLVMLGVKAQASENGHDAKGSELTNQQQTSTVKGIVRDSSGEPLPGATVTVEGTTQGVATDLDGAYSLKVPEGKKKLVVSYLGFFSQTIEVKGRSTIDVILAEDSKMIDEVVVVGYGVTRRRDLVGAVEQVKGKDLAVQGTMNVSRALQGIVPGMNITLSDGKPSRNANIQLRGAGSIGAGGSALILVDGVDAHGDLTTVNPDDIESVSVLKDASSAAIYGAKGSAGVVLITTKQAQKGKAKVTYSGTVSAHQRLYQPKTVTNGLQWTDGFLASYEGAKDSGIPPAGINNVFSFNQDWYEELKRRDADPTLEKVRINAAGKYEYFGDTDWFDVIYKDLSWSTQHNVSVSGASDAASYYVSGRFFNQDGIYKEASEDYTQYNFRARGKIKISKQVTIENNTDFVRRTSRQPMVMYDRQNILRQIEHQGYPMTMPRNPDGSWTEAAVYTGWAGFVEGTSFQENKKFDIKNTTTLTYIPIENLIFKGDFSYYKNSSQRVRAEDQYTYKTGPAISGVRNTFSSLENYNYENEYMAANATVNYLPKFNNKDHRLNLLAGWNVESKKTTNTRTYQKGLMYPSKPSLGLTDGEDFIINQTGAEWAYVGILFRANYNLKDKYLAEISGRYDASSNFPSNKQWGLFPSASLGWRVSEENFMSSTKGWLDNLKLRVSAGSLGNGTVPAYTYMSLMKITRMSAILDGSLPTQAQAPDPASQNLTWEKTTSYDIGLDADLLNNRLNIVFDYYRKNTTDMYTIGPSLPGVYGATIPKGNNADMKTLGWELSVQWRSEFMLASKPFSYSIKGMVWDDRSWITKYNNPTRKLGDYYEGQRLGEIWGYQVDGLFRSQAEIDGHADQSFLRVSDTNRLLPGDLKFADLDGSGAINNGKNTVEDSGDLKKIGNTSPRYHFGVNLSGNWNGIGVSAFVQGIAKRDWYPHRESAFFWGQYNRPYSYGLQDHTGDKIWTEQNQNFDAYWPRMRGYLAQGAGKAMGTANDRYLQNAAYVRLKNLQIDYTFNKSICKVLHVDGLKVYVTGDNLITWSPMFKHTKNFDPENIGAGDTDFRSSNNSDGDGYGYPMLRTFTFGLSVTF